VPEFGGPKRICLCNDRESYPSDDVDVSFSIIVPNANRNNGGYEPSAFSTKTNTQSVKAARAQHSELRIQISELYGTDRRSPEDCDGEGAAFD
jgi:hypothetical protein